MELMIRPLLRSNQNRLLAPVLIWGLLCALSVSGSMPSSIRGQDLSWVRGAMERSKQASRESIPLWQYDPRVAAGSADASLNCVTSASADRIWAVGDRGLILASQNGGRTWTAQSPITTLNLHAIAFVNERQGVIVGGTVQPLSRTSVGVVLATDDGGERWRVVNSGSLARMTGLSLSQGGVLTAWGDYSALHNSAVYESHDFGVSWQAVASPLGHIRALGRHVGGLQLGIDSAGRIAQLPAKPDHHPRQFAPPTLPIAALGHTGLQWIAVGHGGTLAASRDGWQWVDCALPLSSFARAACNLRCMSTVDGHVWAAGHPGSVLLHSDDQGNTWRVQPSDQRWPINSLHFFDQHRGWAVTDGGSILATRDGGKSWFVQRQPMQRLGMQAYAALPTQISWPALADATWQSKQATALSVIHRENTEDAVDFQPDGPATLAAIGSQASLVKALQSSARPLADRRLRHGDQLASYYRAARVSEAVNPRNYDFFNSGLDMTGELTVQLRTGRPSVVMIDDLPGDQSSLLTEAVVRAVQRAAAADPSTAWLDHELYLPPWQVSKVFAGSPVNQAEFNISVDRMLGDSGLSVIDSLAPVFGFASGGFSNASLRCLQFHSTSLAARTTMFHASDRQTDSTRPVDLSKIGNFQLVMGRVHRDKAWQALAGGMETVEEDLPVWSRKLESIVDQTPRHEVGAALIRLAESEFHAGRWQRWRAALERAIALGPQSDTTRWSTLEELRYDASDERLAWEISLQSERNQESSNNAIQLTSATAPIGNLSQPLHLTPFENDAQMRTALAQGSSVPRAEVVTASAQQPAAAQSRQDQALVSRLSALKRAVHDYSRLSEADMAVARRPDLQLAHFARRRALAELASEPAPDPSSVQAIASSSPLAGWQQVAEQELVLASGRQTLPAWTARAQFTPERPRLDAVADEPFWRRAVPIALTSPFDPQSRLRPTNARFAYDDQYLYILLHCPVEDTRATTSSSTREPRHYDMSLDDTDHLQLVLDTDRDYVSASELAVNDAGHTFDRCCGAEEWNPYWKVAVEKTADGWTAELAIRLSDLTTAQTVTGRAWAISAFRYIPKHDVQSWSQLRSYVPRHQGNGLLVFDP